jgi:hypothetical protein
MNDFQFQDFRGILKQSANMARAAKPEREAASIADRLSRQKDGQASGSKSNPGG